ncbi:MAG TPA: hypothetical protein VFT55_14805 [Planctomycetota bacterium]|nr:hypothetical protein [Planctomycetota bacterium]
MRAFSVADLGPSCARLFRDLEQAGFKLSVDDYSPASFGDFVVTCSSPKARLRVTSDRGQVFVDVASPSGGWRDKEAVLEAAGIPRTRHPTVRGLWTGYEPQVQSVDLRQHLAVLLAAIDDGAA